MNTKKNSSELRLLFHETAPIVSDGHYIQLMGAISPNSASSFVQETGALSYYDCFYVALAGPADRRWQTSFISLRIPFIMTSKCYS